MKKEQLELYALLLSDFSLLSGFKNKHLREKLQENPKTAKIAYELIKLRERGAIKKLQKSYYYQLTKEGYVWIFCSFSQNKHLSKPLFSSSYIKTDLGNSDQASIIEGAYSDINRAISLITSEFKLVS